MDRQVRETLAAIGLTGEEIKYLDGIADWEHLSLSELICQLIRKAMHQVSP